MRTACIALLSLVSIASPLRANVIATAQIELTRLTITPSAGFIQLLPFPGAPDDCSQAASAFCAQSFAHSGNLGGFDDHLDSGNGDTSASSAIALTSATARASATDLSASGSVSVEIGVTPGAASSRTESSLTGIFMVAGVSSGQPVNVQFTAFLKYQYEIGVGFLKKGRSATSEMTFSLALDGGSPLVFLDQLNSLGPGSTGSGGASGDFPFPVSKSFTTFGDTPVYLHSSIVTSAAGTNQTAIPEPSALVELLFLLALCVAIPGLRLRFRRCGD